MLFIDLKYIKSLKSYVCLLFLNSNKRNNSRDNEIKCWCFKQTKFGIQILGSVRFSSPGPSSTITQLSSQLKSINDMCIWGKTTAWGWGLDVEGGDGGARSPKVRGYNQLELLCLFVYLCLTVFTNVPTQCHFTAHSVHQSKYIS